MHIICLTPLAPGVYNDHSAEHITYPPAGWAYIPKDFPLPSTFPRLGSLEAELVTYTREVEVEKEVTKTREVETTQEVPKFRDVESVDEEGNPITVTEEYTMMTVTKMTEGTLPEPSPEPEIPADEGSVWDELDAAYQEGVDSV